VFRGLATSFVDARVANGVRYAYEVRARDAASNSASQTAVGVPSATGPDAAPPGPTARSPRAHRRPHLIAPRAGTLVRPRRPPLLRWTPVRRARYYNLQLWRLGHSNPGGESSAPVAYEHSGLHREWPAVRAQTADSTVAGRANGVEPSPQRPAEPNREVACRPCCTAQ
jgi:hypothetical protein